MQNRVALVVGFVAAAALLVDGQIFNTPIDTNVAADTEQQQDNSQQQNNNSQQNIHHHQHHKNKDSNIDERFDGQQPTGGLLQYNFKPDFQQLINPANPNADWRWARASSGNESVMDSATFLKDAPSSIDMISLPFRVWYPQNDSVVVPLLNNYEALLVNKQNFTVLPGQKLDVSIQFACKTFNNEDQPLPTTAVSNPSDDPSLAACGFDIASYDESALAFSIVATNKGVWAIYERNRFEIASHPERGQKEFTVFQRLSSRKSPYDIVNGCIKYDNSKNKVEFLVDGKVKHTITELGTLNHAVKGEELQKAYADVYTMDRDDLIQSQPKNFQVSIGLREMGDTIDPNNPSNPPLRGSKYTTNPNYYDPKAKFTDNDNLKSNNIWGEGASMTLVGAQIKLSASSGEGEGNSSNDNENQNNNNNNNKHSNMKGGRAGRFDNAATADDAVNGGDENQDNQ